MWKYVSRRVKDSIELGINVRKTFSIQHGLNNDYLKQQQQNERRQNVSNLNHIDYRLIPKHQDPSRDKDKKDERFNKKYNRLHNNQKCFLNALKWVRWWIGLETFCYFDSSSSFSVDRYHHRILCITTALLVPTQSAVGHRRHQVLLLQIPSQHHTTNPSQCPVPVDRGQQSTIADSIGFAL